MTDIPHFGLPFRYDNGAAVVVEQDTSDEIMMCDLAILLCPRGYRVELPTFGIVDPTFDEQPLDSTPIAAALSEWEPRSQELVESSVDALDELVAYVRIQTGTPSDD